MEIKKVFVFKFTLKLEFIHRGNMVINVLFFNKLRFRIKLFILNYYLRYQSIRFQIPIDLGHFHSQTDIYISNNMKLTCDMETDFQCRHIIGSIDLLGPIFDICIVFLIYLCMTAWRWIRMILRRIRVQILIPDPSSYQSIFSPIYI